MSATPTQRRAVLTQPAQTLQAATTVLVHMDLKEMERTVKVGQMTLSELQNVRHWPNLTTASPDGQNFHIHTISTYAGKLAEWSI